MHHTFHSRDQKVVHRFFSWFNFTPSNIYIYIYLYDIYIYMIYIYISTINSASVRHQVLVVKKTHCDTVLHRPWSLYSLHLATLDLGNSHCSYRWWFSDAFPLVNRFFVWIRISTDLVFFDDQMKEFLGNFWRFFHKKFETVRPVSPCPKDSSGSHDEGWSHPGGAQKNQNFFRQWRWCLMINLRKLEPILQSLTNLSRFKIEEKKSEETNPKHSHIFIYQYSIFFLVTSVVSPPWRRPKKQPSWRASTPAACRARPPPPRTWRRRPRSWRRSWCAHPMVRG